MVCDPFLFSFYINICICFICLCAYTRGTSEKKNERSASLVSKSKKNVDTHFLTGFLFAFFGCGSLHASFGVDLFLWSFFTSNVWVYLFVGVCAGNWLLSNDVSVSNEKLKNMFQITMRT